MNTFWKTRGVQVLLAGLFLFSLVRADEIWSAAAERYLAKEYAAAYQLAEAQLAEHPGDPVLIRLMGMSLLDAGHPVEAVRVLQEGLSLHPASVAMAYYLAQAYAYAGRIDESIVLVEEILLHAPDSEYGQRSREALEGLRALQRQRGVTESVPDRVDVFVRVGVDHDDNLPGRAKDDPSGDPESVIRLSAAAQVLLRLMDQDQQNVPFTLGVQGTAYRSWHDRDIYKVYNVDSLGGGGFISRRGTLGSLPSFTRLGVNHSDTRLDGEGFSEITQMSLAKYVQVVPRVTLGVNGGYAWKDFAGTTEYPEYFDRDGEDWSAGTSMDFRFLDNRVTLGLGYGYREADTEGSQFRVGSHNGSVTLGLLLPLGLHLSGGVDYQQTDYPDFLPDPQRLDDVWSYNLSLRRPFADQRYAVELNVGHTRANSNREFARYEQTVYGVAVSLNL